MILIVIVGILCTGVIHYDLMNLTKELVKIEDIDTRTFHLIRNKRSREVVELLNKKFHQEDK